ncbi:hypothetical protein ARMGADRAFT_1161608 [Armillaria gallica]|uniref:Uncharacterized protein n=1 Tax=Armillaria gallica TaxID=47427 RepID=A0A2H3E4F7_ARMGA|nr:hypothetical protein ARMGADRAFT_1161608 [Armillaria gallica]
MSSSPEPDPEVDTTYLDFLALRAASLGDLLHTNSPPSEREANLRETELRDAHDVLEKLDQEIEQAQIALSSLMRNRKVIKEIIHKYKTVLSPARRLAPEILTEIFRWTITDKPGFSVTDTKRGP